MTLPYEFSAKTVIDEGRTTQGTVDQIKEWLRTTTLPQVPEEMIVLFLLSCKNVVATTKATIQAYFKIKNEAPEIFNNRDIDSGDLQKAMSVVSCISIPVRTGDNTVIHFFKVTDSNYQNFDWILSMKLAYMLLDISQSRNPPNELIVVIDMQGVGFMHLTRFKIGAARKFLEFLQEGMPLRIKMIHVLNSTYVFDKLISIARVFIRNELMAIIKTHPPGTDMMQFHKECLPVSCLPKEYGGDLPTVEELNKISIQRFRELKPFFEAEEKFRRFYN